MKAAAEKSRKQREAAGSAQNEVSLYKIQNLARDYFGECARVRRSLEGGDAWRVCDTRRLLDQGYSLIGGATFADEVPIDGTNLSRICIVNTLRIEPDGVHIVDAAKDSSDWSIPRLSFQMHMLEAQGFTVKSASVMYLNEAYICEVGIDLHRLFDIKDITKNVNEYYASEANVDLQRLFVVEDVTDKAHQGVAEVLENMEMHERVMASPEEPFVEVGEQCTRKSCLYRSWCM